MEVNFLDTRNVTDYRIHIRLYHSVKNSFNLLKQSHTILKIEKVKTTLSIIYFQSVQLLVQNPFFSSYFTYQCW